MNFWRAKDVYSDHMVRTYHHSGIPLERIDSSAFMIGNTGTCYYRKTAAWQGMLILSFARGGWANTIYGNLELLDSGKGEWFRNVQDLFLPLQSSARFTEFGGIPGKAETYGYAALCARRRPAYRRQPQPTRRHRCLADRHQKHAHPLSRCRI